MLLVAYLSKSALGIVLAQLCLVGLLGAVVDDGSELASIGCAHNPAHSWLVGGSRAPACVRCTATYCGSAVRLSSSITLRRDSLFFFTWYSSGSGSAALNESARVHCASERASSQ